MLEDRDIDAVAIATCDHWHTPVALAVVMSGKHVYVENPSSHTVHEANLLMKAAKLLGRRGRASVTIRYRLAEHGLSALDLLLTAHVCGIVAHPVIEHKDQP